MGDIETQRKAAYECGICSGEGIAKATQKLTIAFSREFDQRPVQNPLPERRLSDL
jgi:hypothetical protein